MYAKLLKNVTSQVISGNFATVSKFLNLTEVHYAFK